MSAERDRAAHRQALEPLRAEVARRYAARDLPAWPNPRPDGSPPREEEYSRVSDPQRFRIVGTRARLWAEVLAEAGAVVVPEPMRSITQVESDDRQWDVAVDQALRVDPPAGVAGAVPWWLLESDVPQDDDGATLPYVRVAVGAPDQVHALLPDCGCDACDCGSVELLDAVDEAVGRAVGTGVTLRGRHGRRGQRWEVRWSADGTAEGTGPFPGGSFEALTDACQELAAGERPTLPRGTEVTVGAGWFPGA